MSRYTARHAVAAWLGGPPSTLNTLTDQHGNNLIYGQPSTVISGVGTVLAAWPAIPDENDFTAGMPAGTVNGARIVVHLPGPQVESREAIGGATGGMKKIQHRAFLQVFGLSTEPHVEIAQTVFDDVLDAIVARVRADRTFGGLVFQAGESITGIHTETTQPVTTDTAHELYGQVWFDVLEFLPNT